MTIDFQTRGAALLSLADPLTAEYVERVFRKLAADVLNDAAHDADATAAILAAQGVLADGNRDAAFSAAIKALNESANSIRAKATEVLKP